MLAGIFAIAATQVAATTSGSALAPPSLSGLLLPFVAGGPAVDLAPADDETAREPKARVATADSDAASHGRLGLVHFYFAPIPAAEPAPTGRIAFSLGPRAPPRAFNFDFRRLAWQA